MKWVINYVKFTVSEMNIIPQLTIHCNTPIHCICVIRFMNIRINIYLITNMIMQNFNLLEYLIFMRLLTINLVKIIATHKHPIIVIVMIIIDCLSELKFSEIYLKKGLLLILLMCMHHLHVFQYVLFFFRIVSKLLREFKTRICCIHNIFEMLCYLSMSA